MSDKADKFAPIPREDDPQLYAMMDDLIRDHHATDLAEAKIALVWEYEVKEDRDGNLRWGKAKKVAPLEREFHDHDFIILLNWTVWQSLPGTARRALLDHELTHCACAIDENTGDTSYYVRKHDLEEFSSIVSRHGLWREGVKKFVDAALKKKDPTLFDEKDTRSPQHRELDEKLEALVDGEKKPPPAALNAMADLAGAAGSRGHSVTIEVPGQTSVTLTPDMAPTLRKAAAEMRREDRRSRSAGA